MLDSAYGELARPDDVPGGWRSRLEHVARERWALYRRHPWMLQVAVSRPPLGPNVTANYEYELRAIADIGLTELEMDSIVTLVADHVEGAARRAVDAALAEQRTGMSDREWWDAHAPILSQVFDPARSPTATRVGAAAGEAHQAAYNPEHAFEFGLQRVLDGIEAFIARRAE
jgi:hypothetical protein